MSHYQLYRNTTLGVTLQDTLDEMIAVRLSIESVRTTMIRFSSQDR